MIGKQASRGTGTVIERFIAATRSVELLNIRAHEGRPFAVLLQVGWHVSPAVFHKIKKVNHSSVRGERSRKYFS